MRRIVFRGYIIIATAQQREGVWNSHARVSQLRAGRERELHEKSSFTSEMHAEAHALRLAQHWVNKRLEVRQRLVFFLSLVGIAVAVAGLFIVLWTVDI
jgi:hypothetical protein